MCAGVGRGERWVGPSAHALRTWPCPKIEGRVHWAAAEGGGGVAALSAFLCRHSIQ